MNAQERWKRLYRLSHDNPLDVIMAINCKNVMRKLSREAALERKLEAAQRENERLQKMLDSQRQVISILKKEPIRRQVISILKKEPIRYFDGRYSDGFVDVRELDRLIESGTATTFKRAGLTFVWLASPQKKYNDEQSR